MVRFISVALALFLLFAGTWIWYSGDTRPLQASYWKNLYASLSSGGQTTTVATVTGKTADPVEKPKTVSEPTETMAAAITRVATPAGRYVMAKLGATAPAAPAAATMAIAAVGSPAGRYVEAPKMVMPAKETVSQVIKRIGSPLGRYITAPAMAAPTPNAYTVVSSPGGRYVDAPAATAAAPTKITPVGSPAGRYVDAPAMVAEPAPANLARVSSPAGRYVDAPKAAPAAPRKSASGALVFPVSFEYRKSSFTTKGRAAADQLLAHILAKKYNDVTLSGHTDNRGSQSVNLAISESRLQTVAEHLKAGGYNGGISLKPKGKSEPFTGIDRSKYTAEQLYDFDRRVELVSGK